MTTEVRRSGRIVRAGAATALLAAALIGGTGAASAEGYGLGYDPTSAKGSLWSVAEAVGAHQAYAAGYTGNGVGVALIDTGVVQVPGLDTGNVVDGPDLSFDSQAAALAHKDAFGHGTHLASIIAGRDAASSPAAYASPSTFAGIAPDATLLNVKVGAYNGAVDVSQVIAGIDWVVEHRDDRGMNIRVLNLSYGTDSVQPTEVDPLAYAVERAWKAGIVVVVSGGNDGSDSRLLGNPARSPYVLAVGADDTQGTPQAADDTVPAWASRGTNQRHVDLVAPGVSVLGLRVPGGYADQLHPGSRAGTRFAKASGTSQAAAVVSGAVALLLQQHPGLTPDQVKKLLMTTAHPFASTDVKHRGRGLLDVAEAAGGGIGQAHQPQAFLSDGSGSLEAARGSVHVTDGVTELRGEIDIFGNRWDGPTWAAASAAGTAWDGNTWGGNTWGGNTWGGNTWGGNTWGGNTWGGNTWGGNTWGGNTWGGADLDDDGS